MADIPAIKVTRQGDQHVCDPTEVTVEPGDTVAWVGRETFFVSFPNGTPFDQAGNFANGQRVTVSTTLGLHSGQRFTPKFKVRDQFLEETKGSVIIR
jgi:plastocyanin